MLRPILCLIVLLSVMSPAAGQTLLRDLDTMPVGLRPDHLTRVGDRAYFIGIDSEAGREWWVTDGTTAGTRKATGLASGTGTFFRGDERIIVGTELIFWSRSTGELWIIDAEKERSRRIRGLPDDQGTPLLIPTPRGAAVVFNEPDVALLFEIGTGQSEASPLPLHCSGPCDIVTPVAVEGSLYFFLKYSRTDLRLLQAHLSSAVVEEVPILIDPHAQILGAVGSRLLFANKGDDGDFKLFSRQDSTFTPLSTLASYPNRVGIAKLGTDNGMMFLLAELSGGGSGLQFISSDGTPEGTVSHAHETNSFWPYQSATLPSGRIVFPKSDGDHGEELWITDGTPEGTELVKDIRMGGRSSSPFVLTRFNDLVYFCATDGIHGTELWRSDGTPEGTRMVTDLLPGTMGSNPEMFVELNARILTETYVDGRGSQLVSVDPETGSTEILTTSSLPISRSSQPVDFVQTGNEAVFRARNTLFGYQTWISDGTSEGTRLLAVPGVDNPMLRFLAETSAFSLWEAGNGLVVHDKSSSVWTSIPLLVDGRLGDNGQLSQPKAAVARDRILLSPLMDENGQQELWITDGTEAGTQPMPTQLTAAGMNPLGWIDDGWVVIQNNFLFRIDGAEVSRIGFDNAFDYRFRSLKTDSLLYLYSYSDKGLWATDGSEEGTRKVSGSADFDAGFAMIEDGLITSDLSPGHSGRELTIRTHPDTVKTILDLNPGSASSAPRHIQAWNGHAIFTARVDGGDRQVWITDGTESGTHVLIPDLAGAGAEDWHDTVTLLASDENGFLFTVRHGTFGREPWYSDGTQAGTILLADMMPGPDESRPRGGALVGDQFIFSASFPGIGTELFSVSLAYLATDRETLTLPSAVSHLEPGYPNPASTVITFPMTPRTDGQAEVSVFDILGRRHVAPLEWADDHLRIDTSRLPAGVYFVRTSDANSATTRRFVKQ